MTPPSERPSDRTGSGPDFAVVGIGASAGGLQALLQLFKGAPASPGIAFVVVLHLSPDHASQAHEVIQRVTDMRVEQVRSPVPLEKNTVYVIPPGKLLSMVDGYLRLSEPELPRFPPTSIDLFFRSLADAHGSRSLAVVLSGAGSDGSVGISRIRERGGITIAQRPEEAQYPDMPKSAIDTGDVDIVLPVGQIMPRVVALARNAAKIRLPAPSDEQTPNEAEPPAPDADAIDDVLAILRTRSRHDFSNYKRGTVVRRIERRMQVNRVSTAAAYREFLTEHADETPKLLADMLIGVTNFFRDPVAFAALERSVIPQIMKNLKERDEIRAWVPACATGEEAFSIAMLLDEAASRAPHRPRVIIYATDIDEHAIAVARAGSYPKAIENDVPPARLGQYFHKDGNRYRVVKSLRDTVIFAAHNLLLDPPFSRLDLVSCRNVLIYLDRRAQKYVLDALHFSLRPHEGVLLLGAAESADFNTEQFRPVDKQQKIYRAAPHVAANRTFNFPHPNGQAAQSGHAFFTMPDDTKPREPFLPSQTRALDLYGPAVIVMRPDGAILHRSVNANRLTENARRERVDNLFDIVRGDAQAEVRRTIQKCLNSARREVANAVPFLIGLGQAPVDLSFRPYRDLAHQEHLISVTCDSLIPLPDAAPAHIPSAGADTIESLRMALAGSEDRLSESRQHGQASSEQLRASNEELQAMNEELRSATEELEASREELQSLNEELLTVNSELIAKVHESARVSDDLQNLISLVGVATIFVDRALRIKRYTSPADTLFNIRFTDMGRPLEDLTHRLDYPDMLDDLRTAFESLKRSEREVTTVDGRAFLARVLPYRTDDDRIDGAVLALIDISEQKLAQEHARRSEEKLHLAAHATHDFAIIVIDEDGKVASWNVGANRLFGFEADEILDRPLDPIFTAKDLAEGIPAKEREKADQFGRAEDERWHVTKSGARIFCSGFLSRIEVPGFSGYTKIVHDATERKLADGRKNSVLELERADHVEVRKLSRLKDEFIAVLSHELKNPLNLIHIKAEILARIPEARHIGRVQEVSDAIQKSVLTQAQIIDDLLDFSRIQTGKLSLRFAPTDFAGVVRSIVDAMRTDFDNGGVALRLDVPQTPALIRADAVRIEQIVWNLLSNALKFTPQGGEVAVRIQQNAESVRLEVADTGCGLAPDTLSSIFDMYRQTPNVPCRARPGGLGIGLSLVRQLALLHGGTVDAFSDGENKGACFVVVLPADASFAHGAAGDAPADLSVFAEVRVLVIDDQQDSLDAMTDLLALYGARVSGANGAADALRIAGETEFDLAIAHIDHLGADASRIARQLRDVQRAAKLAVVALTGRATAQEEARALAAGFDACLSTPFNLATLADFMRRFFDDARSGD
ncbi:chemotaxis protein [Caballeronia temeraria]|uniref:histidine kinase n=1 Tax=Caballeronia temeraria TaxID=1777137 RepID=A0A158A3J9_9BURK|nr:chemotaxis protein CheB [Caballeronia temeraria]SAK52392.1 chemotaxis protein [Caballeronia temeraria]